MTFQDFWLMGTGFGERKWVLSLPLKVQTQRHIHMEGKAILEAHDVRDTMMQFML